MSSTPAVSPTSAEVHEHLQRAARRRPDLLTVRTLGRTRVGDLPIEVAIVTDRDYPADDKQHVLIVAGQHGNEESARLVALRVIDYLLGTEGRPLLKKQLIAVMPNVSPDAAEHDTYETPAGIKPNLDHGPGGPKSPEAKAVQLIAEELQPEVYVDLHARGHAGWSHDMVLFPPTRAYTEDEHLLHEIASIMAAEGEKSGIPHVVHPLTWPGWGGTDLDQPSSTLWMYRQFKTLVFLTENAEHNEGSYSDRVRAASGLNRLKPLLAMGNTRHPKQYYNGYPIVPVVGMYHAGAVAVGATAAARRASRVQIWRNTAGFKSLGPAIPEREDVKRLLVEYTGQPITGGIGFQVRTAKRVMIQSVRFNGRKLKSAETNGYYTWHDKHTTFAVAALPSLELGKHEITFNFQ